MAFEQGNRVGCVVSCGTNTNILEYKRMALVHVGYRIRFLPNHKRKPQAENEKSSDTN